MNFESRYKGLNKAQQKAVDTIDGPVMVIAGPGTGKTELLSMRAANILRLTDTNPSSILCITFTDIGAAAIRERLVSIIGQDAYKVAIHTFHSFGSEIINQNPEYFYNGAHYSPSDDLTTRKILEDIFSQLPHSNILSGKSQTGYTYLSDVQNVISELKKSGLTGTELLKILDSNELTIQKSNKILNEIFSSASRINMSMVSKVHDIIPTILATSTNTGFEEFKPLADILSYYLQEAVEQSLEINKTTPLTAWRNEWMQKNSKNDFELKATVNQAKLRSTAGIYDSYLAKMETEKLYDFDDMILRVVHSCLTHPELRYNLQEKFQYIMVDEFQDTNFAQMRLIGSLTDTLIDSDSPNIMVVGDDDQAIYSFQGADISNIINFSHKYPGAKIISLIENYRSTPEVLMASRKVIVQGNDRLENHYTELNKSLNANKKSGVEVKLYESPNYINEKQWLVNSIKDKIDSGAEASEIAVLTRKHNDIVEILPYFAHHNIKVSYEKNDNILEQEPIKWLLSIMNIVHYLKTGRHNKSDDLMPEFISHKSWSIEPSEIFSLSLEAHKEKKTWIEVMSETGKINNIYNFIITAVVESANLPFEKFLDYLMGVTGEASPFIEYFFNAKKREENPEMYITHLSSLSTLRKKFREYQPNNDPTLETFLEFIYLHDQAGVGIYIKNDHAGNDDGVRIMTAHKSKGLEFNTVYIFNATENTWGYSSRSKNRMINYPNNIPLKSAGDTNEEKMRIFYVAMTRAKNELTISYSDENANGKHSDMAAFLVDDQMQPIAIGANNSDAFVEENTAIEWYQPLLESHETIQQSLKERLKNYKLSATHLNSFLDVTRGGPEHFLIHNMLQFPESKSANSAYGSAIHDALKLAHEHMKKHKTMQPHEDIIANFEKILKKQRLPERELEFYTVKGRDNLSEYLKRKDSYFTPNQIPELDFKDQQSLLENGARITGKLDVFAIKSDKTSSVIDYKTGKSPKDWKGEDDNEKVKLHKYRQQLIFYKILIENSRDYAKNNVSEAKLIFVEPNKDDEIVELSIDFTQEEIDRTKKLIQVVWNHVINLNLPDISEYSKNLKGIKAFEDKLLEEI